MKLLPLILTGFAFQAIAMAGITPSGSVLTESGAPYDGSDPWVISFGRLNIGSSTSFGSLEINSGSTVTASSGTYVTSPTAGGSISSLLVDGVGSKVTTSFLFVDASLLRVSNGASADVFDLGSSSVDGRTAQTFIEGPGTTLNTSYLGFTGNGNSQITVTDGAVLTSGYLNVWSDQGSFTVNVGGGANTSRWFQDGTLIMGAKGNDLIDIRGGGLVRIAGGSFVLGYRSSNSSGALVSGAGTIRVDGTDGAAELQLQVSSYIGREGTGRLVVTNGGKVFSNNFDIRLGDSSGGGGGSGTLSIGGGEKVSTLEGRPVLSAYGTTSLIEVLENGVLEVSGLAVSGGAKVVVGGGSAPALLSIVPNPPPTIFPTLPQTGGSRWEIRQGGTISATAFNIYNAAAQVSLDGGTLKGGGYLGGLPVQIMAGGGTIQADNGTGFTLVSTTGSGMLTKMGSGSMTFSGQVNHAGTRVLEGSLNLAAGSQTTGTVDIFTGARLTGTGTLDGLLTLHRGAVIAPGNSPGILQTASSAWMSGGRYEWEINNALGNKGINWDLVQVNGGLDLLGLSASDPFVIAVRSLFSSGGNPGFADGFDPLLSYRFTILTTTNGIAGFDPAAFRLDLTGFVNSNLGDSYWQLEQWNNGLDLIYNFAPVPEPGGVIFIAVTAIAALAQRRRRR